MTTYPVLVTSGAVAATKSGGPDSTGSAVGVPPASSRTFGVLFSAHQAPGYHSVVAGLLDYVGTMVPPGRLIGFVGGWVGLKHGWIRELDHEKLRFVRNLGGQELLCDWEQTLQTSADFACAVDTLNKHRVEALICVGNLPSQLECTVLAEGCAADRDCGTRVIGVPVSVDNDFPFIQQSIGFDTATKIFASIVGSLWCEAATSRQQWFFVRLKGQSHALSHITLETALLTHPNLVLLSEEVAMKRQSLSDVTNMICDVVSARSERGLHFGIVLFPESLLLAVPQTRQLILEIEDIIASFDSSRPYTSMDIQNHLKTWTSTLFRALPRNVQEELCCNTKGTPKKVDLANVSTEWLLARLVSVELERRRALGLFHAPFETVTHELAYQARSGMPTNFDCDLAYTLGYSAGLVADSGKTGYLVHASNLTESPSQWVIGGLPFTSLASLQREAAASQARNNSLGVDLLQSSSSLLNNAVALQNSNISAIIASSGGGLTTATTPGQVQFAPVGSPTSSPNDAGLRFSQSQPEPSMTTSWPVSVTQSCSTGAGDLATMLQYLPNVRAAERDLQCGGANSPLFINTPSGIGGGAAVGSGSLAQPAQHQVSRLQSTSAGPTTSSGFNIQVGGGTLVTNSGGFQSGSSVAQNNQSTCARLYMPSANQRGNIYPELLSSRKMPPPIERSYVNPGPVQFQYDFVSNMLASSKRPPFEKLAEVGSLCAELQRVAASRKGLATTVLEALNAAIALLQSAVQSAGATQDPFFANQRKSLLLLNIPSQGSTQGASE
ncbi:unnamed protein product [Amoebophrya sp. A25]|nr:unnamed protein product [Amoebophrya sp. A25]|eukprot:GSA25T00005222001.1